MSIISHQVDHMLDRLRAAFSATEARERLNARPHQPRAPVLRGARVSDRTSIGSLWRNLQDAGAGSANDERLLADPDTLAAAESYGANIENMIGTVKVPVGVIGPLRINGLNATWRLLCTARDHRSGAGRLLRARRRNRILRRRRERGHAGRGRAAQPRLQVRKPDRGRAVRRMGGALVRRPQGGSGVDHPVRQARFARADDGQRHRLPALPLHDRRRLRPEHGDDRNRSALPPHRSALPGAAAALVHRSQFLRRQEEHLSRPDHRPWPQGYRLRHDSIRADRAGPAYQRRTHDGLRLHGGSRRHAERPARRAGALCQRAWPPSTSPPARTRPAFPNPPSASPAWNGAAAICSSPSRCPTCWSARSAAAPRCRARRRPCV